LCGPKRHAEHRLRYHWV